MNPFVDQHCQDLPKGTPPASAEDVAAALEVLSGWSVDADHLVKTFSFANYYKTMAFVNAVAFIAHREDHHPDLAVSYKTCGIRYSTHSVGGISVNDFICAAQIDALILA